jgi:hypothetical protein
VAALQQADLGGGITRSAGTDRTRLHHQHVLAGAGQKKRGHQPGDPSTHNNDIGGPGAVVKLACSPRLFDSVAKPQRSHGWADTPAAPQGNVRCLGLSHRGTARTVIHGRDSDERIDDSGAVSPTFSGRSTVSSDDSARRFPCVPMVVKDLDLDDARDPGQSVVLRRRGAFRESSGSRAFSPRRLGSTAAVCSASTRVAATDLDLGPETRRPGRCGVWCYQPRVSVLRAPFRVAICSA